MGRHPHHTADVLTAAANAAKLVAGGEALSVTRPQAEDAHGPLTHDARLA